MGRHLPRDRYRARVLTLATHQFALGLIYEQYGDQAAALAAYDRVHPHEYDNHTYIDPTSTYNLAQARLTALRR